MAKNPLCCLLWFILLYPAFIIAFFCSVWYVLLYPFTVCISACSGLTDILLQGVQLPHTCAKKMVGCEGC